MPPPSPGPQTRPHPMWPWHKHPGRVGEGGYGVHTMDSKPPPKRPCCQPSASHCASSDRGVTEQRRAGAHHLWGRWEGLV